MWIAIVILSVLLVLSILLNPVTLVLVLRPALACVDGESRKPAHLAAAMQGLVVNLLATVTWWRLIAGPRQGRERTISDTLERLCITPGERQQLFIEIAKEINRASPTGRHIKAVLNL